MNDDAPSQVEVTGRQLTCPNGSTIFAFLVDGSVGFVFERDGVKTHLRLSHEAVEAMQVLLADLRGGVAA